MTLKAIKKGEKVKFTYKLSNGKIIKKSYIANGIKDALEQFRTDFKI